jgi:hypothetical protein
MGEDVAGSVWHGHTVNVPVFVLEGEAAGRAGIYGEQDGTLRVVWGGNLFAHGIFPLCPGVWVFLRACMG